MENYNLRQMLLDENVDDIARSLLERVFPILEKGVENSSMFYMASSEGPDSPIREDELAYWNQAFNLTNVVLEDTRAGKLFVPDLSIGKDRMIEGGSNPPVSDYQSTALVPLGGKRVRINLKPGKGTEISEGYIYPFRPEGMTLTIKPILHLSGRYDPRGLYNAFMSFKFKVFSEHGLPVLDMIDGTQRVANWMKPEVYSPYSPINTSCWFNTTIDPSKSNGLGISIDKDRCLMINAQLHQGERISNLPIPENDKVKLFFWQANRFVNRLQLPEGNKALPAPEKPCLKSSDQSL